MCHRPAPPDVALSSSWLDGGRIAVSLLPHRMAWQFSKLEPYGLAILLVLLFTDILGVILWPLMVGFRQLLAVIFQF